MTGILLTVFIIYYVLLGIYHLLLCIMYLYFPSYILSPQRRNTIPKTTSNTRKCLLKKSLKTSSYSLRHVTREEILVQGLEPDSRQVKGHQIPAAPEDWSIHVGQRIESQGEMLQLGKGLEHPGRKVGDLVVAQVKRGQVAYAVKGLWGKHELK